MIYLVNNVSPASIPIEVANKLSDNFEVIVVSLYDNKEEAINKIKENNLVINVIGVGMKNKFDLIKYINLYNIIKQLKPDIIHTHHTLSGFLGRIFSKIMGNINIITTIHNDMRFFNIYQKLLRVSNLNFADCIICNSKNTKNSFAKWQNKLIDNKKKKIIYNGVNINKIMSYKYNNIKDKYDLSKKSFLIGNIAMLEKQKDQETLIRAFNIFKSEIENAKLIIVGAGSLKEKLNSVVSKLGLNEDVIFTGLVSRDEVYKIINSIDLFVMSSIYEGFCNAMVEAMVAENAIIATNIPPLPEVLGKENGIFFEKKSYKNLASNMLRLYKDEELRNNLAVKAKEYAINNYSLDECVKNYEKIYLKLLD
ncbi:glycosyltransferase family 4 protein [Sporohalobacter salinus]|uniref:glycosyltransferase family 4 protein n=1 Tax=Sporohalobacter salinus TaxID=1494606 RepID=UPI0030B837FB